VVAVEAEAAASISRAMAAMASDGAHTRKENAVPRKSTLSGSMAAVRQSGARTIVREPTVPTVTPVKES